MNRFTDFPREIRDMIYTFYLVVDAEIMPYEENYDPVKATVATPPQLALLRTNKMIRAEATNIFYAKNTWRIGPSLSTHHFQTFDLWEQHKDLVRHMTLHITRYDVGTGDVYRSFRGKYPGPNTTVDDMVVRIHKASSSQYGRPFTSNICLSMRQLLERVNALSTLILDVHILFPLLEEESFRKVALVATLYTLEELTTSLNRSGCAVTVRGLRGEEELRIVQMMLPFAKTETVVAKQTMW